MNSRNPPPKLAKSLLLFLLNDVLLKTILLCFLATFLSHILLILNPIQKKSTIDSLSGFLPRSTYTKNEIKLCEYIGNDILHYWIKSEENPASHRIRPVLSYLMTRDMASALQSTPSLRLEKKIISQEKFIYYFIWLKNLVSGDFGISAQGLSIKKEVLTRIPVTFGIALSSLAIIVLIAFYGSVLYTLKMNWTVVRIQDFIFYTIASLPAFIIGYFFLRTFSVGGIGSQNLILPIATLVISNGLLAELLVVMKNSLHSQYQKNYVLFAKTKGITDSQLLMHHVFRNALIEILPKISQKMTFVVSGTIVVEKVFSLNGLTDMLIDGLGSHDNARVLIVILVATFLVRIGTIAANTTLFIFNPRHAR